MTNTKLLKGKIAESGYTQVEIAKFIGVSPWTLNKKLHNKGLFTSREIQALCELLNIENKEPIFFAQQIAKMANKEVNNE